MESTNLRAIHIAPSFPGAKSKVSGVDFLCIFFLPGSSSWTTGDEWHSNSVEALSSKKSGKIGVWKAAKSLKRSARVASRRSWESRPKTSLTLTRRMSIAVRPRCQRTSRKPGSGGFIPSFITEIIPQVLRNLSGSCCGRRPCCGDAQNGGCLLHHFYHRLPMHNTPSTSQAQVPQRSFVCQFSTWRVPICQAVITTQWITTSDHQYTGICKLCSWGLLYPQAVALHCHRWWDKYRSGARCGSWM